MEIIAWVMSVITVAAMIAANVSRLKEILKINADARRNREIEKMRVKRINTNEGDLQ